LSRLYGENPAAWRYDEHFNSPLLLKEPKFLAPSGEFEGCASNIGAHDMVGNLHEWVADTAGPSLGQKIPMIDMIRRTLRRSAGKGVFMGGFFSTTKEHGRGCEFVTIAHEPRYHDYSTGFRCCR
jgi:formylglycine-generating enzyme required for sulfatase activity